MVRGKWRRGAETYLEALDEGAVTWLVSLEPNSLFNIGSKSILGSLATCSATSTANSK
jgi:hypothetical protein